MKKGILIVFAVLLTMPALAIETESFSFRCTDAAEDRLYGDEETTIGLFHICDSDPSSMAVRMVGPVDHFAMMIFNKDNTEAKTRLFKQRINDNPYHRPERYKIVTDFKSLSGKLEDFKVQFGYWVPGVTEDEDSDEEISKMVTFKCTTRPPEN